MAAGNVEWINSQKGKQKLICDEYLFEAYGKGKATAGPNVRYWTCATKGCVVRAKTDGNADVCSRTNEPGRPRTCEQQQRN